MNIRRLAAVLSVCALCGVAAYLVFTGNTAKAAGDSSWGYSLGNMDKSCKPCDDFYQFAMGGWMKNNPIPPEYPSWGTFLQLRDKNLTAMRTILDASTKSSAAAGSNERKIGDFYSSCMDTSAIDAASLQPISGELSAIAALQDRKGLDQEIARFHRANVPAVFEFGSTPDFRDSEHMIAEANQGGLGLPDRDYYTRDDAHSKELRDAYVKHVAKMFELSGDAPDKAAAQAQTVMNIETTLAKASRTNVELRDPEKNYNKLSIAQMQELTPGWSWGNYIQGVGAPSLQAANIGQPEFFKEMNHLLDSTAIADWKVYLKWHLLHADATALSDNFVQENFNFYGKTLSGTKEMQPRWKRCVQATNQYLGEALGEVYVSKYFPPEAKAHAKDMVNNLLTALRSDIPTLS